MNPLILLILLFVLREKTTKRPYIWTAPALPELNYIDTFRMELVLDRLRTMVEALEKINRLSQQDSLGTDSEALIQRIESSLDLAKSFLADTKAEQKIHQISGMVQMLSSAGPLLAAMAQGELLNDEKR